MNKQQLASKIWESANKMRSKIEANEYKDYILGFMFYKFLSEKEYEHYLKAYKTDKDIKKDLNENNQFIVSDCQDILGYFISYDNLFSTWIEMGSDFTASKVTSALSAFERLIEKEPGRQKLFKGVFKTLETGLSKLGETPAATTKAIRDLIHLIKDIPMDGRQDYDVLGFVYEYLISNFAANAGKKAGEFYTPHEVSVLMSEIVADHLKKADNIEIYDPTSGSGSLLINIGKCAAKYLGDSSKIKYFAQELKENTYNLTRMNLVMRGISKDNIVTRNADTLEEDWPMFEESTGKPRPLRVDAVVSNPPYSQNWNPADKEGDPRYASYGLAPKSMADYAFLLHDLYHLKPTGIMTIVLPHGVLFRGGEEGEIRRNLIEKNKIDAIIGLPANIFFGTGIPTIIMVLKQTRANNDVLIIDASKGFEKVGKSNRLRACDIKKIVDAVVARKTVDKFSRVVPRDEIRANEYNLNIPRYVDSSDKPESWDIYSIMYGGVPKKELDELDCYWNEFPGLKEALFKPKNNEYYNLAVADIGAAVLNHSSVAAFRKSFQKAFSGFDKLLKEELIDQTESLNVSKEESVLSDWIFRKMKSVALIDPYKAYQLLDDQWNKIAIDLEMIQTEGFDATTQVEPNMVVKKKDGKEIEVQEGFVGRILPFELAQKMLLAEKTAAVKALEERAAQYASEYEELLEELPEEEKEKDFVNEDKTAFVPAEVKKAIKAQEEPPEILDVLVRFDKLNTEEKTTKKQLKEQSAALHLLTKQTIENLSREQVLELLHEKWITPILVGLSNMPESLLSDFVTKLKRLTAKYETTFDDVEKQIDQTQSELADLLGQLEGNSFDKKGLKELKKLLGGEQ